MIDNALSKRLIAIVVLIFSAVSQAGTIDFAVVDNPGNGADSTGYGAVDNSYHIGTYEVTAGQYAEFLNAVASTSNALGLYNPEMWSHAYGCKIQQTGFYGNYSYNVAAEYADRPVNYVSFWDAARFANWLDSGDTETGGYVNIGDQATFARGRGAQFFIPTEDEWYKAAYHQNDGPTNNYFDYPTGTDSAPSNALNQAGNNATFYADGNTIGPPYYRTKFGAHQNSASAYGTFDQGGNVREWTETAINSSRVLRGGSFTFSGSELNASTRSSDSPTYETGSLGFRIATIPEPGSLAMLAGLAIMSLACWRRRK